MQKTPSPTYKNYFRGLYSNFDLYAVLLDGGLERATHLPGARHPQEPLSSGLVAEVALRHFDRRYRANLTVAGDSP